MPHSDLLLASLRGQGTPDAHLTRLSGLTALAETDLSWQDRRFGMREQAATATDARSTDTARPRVEVRLEALGSSEAMRCRTAGTLDVGIVANPQPAVAEVRDPMAKRSHGPVPAHILERAGAGDTRTAGWSSSGFFRSSHADAWPYCGLVWPGGSSSMALSDHELSRGLEEPGSGKPECSNPAP